MSLLSANPLDSSDILEVVAVQSRALDLFQDEVHTALRTSALNPMRHAEFFGLTSMEILSRFDLYRRETEYHGILTLLARLEAEVKADFQRRSAQVPFNSLFVQWGAQPKFDDLMETWKKAAPINRNSFGNLKSVRRFRHWLAHGRDYPTTLAKSYTLADVATIFQDVISAIASLPTTRSLSPFRSNVLEWRLKIRHFKPFKWI
ncbi:MAG TPA: hypothetical protein VGM92_00155 [Candidatus Kapabacteria bacterium]